MPSKLNQPHISNFPLRGITNFRFLSKREILTEVLAAASMSRCIKSITICFLKCQKNPILNSFQGSINETYGITGSFSELIANVNPRNPFHSMISQIHTAA